MPAWLRFFCRCRSRFSALSREARSSGSPLPKFAGFHYTNALEGAEGQKVLVDGDQKIGFGGNGCAKKRNILRVAADGRIDFSELDESSRHLEEAAELRNFRPGEFEFLAQLSQDLVDDEGR